MDKLIFLLIIAGIGVVLLVIMFTYYKHHKKINDEIESFNNHAHDIDDVLLTDHDKPTFTDHSFDDTELPGSFSANRNDHFDIDQVDLSNDSIAHTSNSDDRELVDGVYINSKRVIRQNNIQPETIPVFKTQTDTFAAFKNSVNTVSGTATKGHENTKTEQGTVAKAEPESTPQDSVARQSPDTETAVTEQPSAEQKPQQNIRITPVSLPEGVNDLIISHSILAKERYFTGIQLYQALSNAGLQFGEMNIYHYPGDDNINTYALFSVANIVEPGTFDPDPEAAARFSTPGISLFMRLPSIIDNYQAYEQFLETARSLAAELNGELCDETRSQLTRQAISYKKEQIRKLNFEIAKAERLAGLAH